MKKNFWKLFLITTLINTLSLSAQEYKLGDPDIDKVRFEVLNQKTSEANYKERAKILYMWLGALQQLGAKTISFFDLDLQYRTLETEINNTLAFGQALTRHSSNRKL